MLIIVLVDERISPRVIRRVDIDALDPLPILFPQQIQRLEILPVDQQAPIFLMLVNGIANHLLVPAEDPFNLTVGQPLTRVYTAFPGKRELKRPSGSSEVITPIRLGSPAKRNTEAKSEDGAKPEEIADAFPRFVVKSERLMESGVYRLARDAPRLGSGPDTELFAVNPDPVEGDLRRFSLADLRADVFKDIPFEAPGLDDLQGTAAEGARGGELWKYLILGALLCLVAEMFAAQRIGARQQ